MWTRRHARRRPRGRHHRANGIAQRRRDGRSRFGARRQGVRLARLHFCHDGSRARCLSERGNWCRARRTGPGPRAGGRGLFRCSQPDAHHGRQPLTVCHALCSRDSRYDHRARPTGVVAMGRSTGRPGRGGSSGMRAGRHGDASRAIRFRLHRLCGQGGTGNCRRVLRPRGRLGRRYTVVRARSADLPLAGGCVADRRIAPWRTGRRLNPDAWIDDGRAWQVLGRAARRRRTGYRVGPGQPRQGSKRAGAGAVASRDRGFRPASERLGMHRRLGRAGATRPALLHRCTRGCSGRHRRARHVIRGR